MDVFIIDVRYALDVLQLMLEVFVDQVGPIAFMFFFFFFYIIIILTKYYRLYKPFIELSVKYMHERLKYFAIQDGTVAFRYTLDTR